MQHLLRHVQQLVQVHTSVGELPERTLLFDLGVRLKQNQHPSQLQRLLAFMLGR